MKVKTNMKCVGCGESTLVQIKKPDYFTPSVGTFNCECCESLLKYTAKKSKEKMMVDVTTKLITVTEKLIEHSKHTQEEQQNETL